MVGAAVREESQMESVHSRRLSRRTVVAGTAGAAAVAAFAAHHEGIRMASAQSTPAATPAGAGLTSAPFGTLNGNDIELYTLTNANGLQVNLMTYGATLQSIMVPDRDGAMANVALGFDNIDDYAALSPFFGATIGRYANRIALGTFELNGNTYQIAVNNGVNTLHGGNRGFDKYVWDAEDVSGSDGPAVMFSRLSPDGEENYPGNLMVSVTFTLNDDDELQLDYSATTDATTVINLTNHVYLNLAGEGTSNILDHVMQLNASNYTPTDETAIPVGGVQPVTPAFDFTTAKPIGQDIRDGSDEQIIIGHGYDHNWVLDRDAGDTTSLFEAATVTDPGSGRMVTCLTTEPGLQFYSGNFLDGTFAGTSGGVYRQGDAFTLETQHFPDSPNQPDFPTTTLEPGDTFSSTTVFRFGVAS